VKSIGALIVAGGLLLISQEQAPSVIFLLAGQSNMFGLGAVKELPAAYAKPPANVVIWEGGQWRRLPAGVTFGPELSFAHTLGSVLPNERLGIVKLAVGGTHIDLWSAADDESLYAELLRRLRAAQGAAPGARVAAMLWMQGERDASTSDAAATYGAKLRRLVLAIRKDVRRPDLPFLCGLVNPPYPYAEAVRAAQARLPKDLANTAAVSTDGLDKKPDNLHYSTSGQIELGRRFAAAYLQLVGSAR
jgi:hypothetical protein